MQGLFAKAERKPVDQDSENTVPRVTHVTPDGEVTVDPITVIKSGPGRKHLVEIEKWGERQQLRR